MGMREALEHLRCCFAGVAVRQLARAQGLAECSPRNVGVRDVDVARIAPARVRAKAAGVLELRHRLRLTTGARALLSLARNDLHGDHAGALLVARKPHGARAAAPEGADRAVSAQKEVRLRLEG